MKKKMKNLINISTLVLLTVIVIFIPILFNKKDNLEISNQVRNQNPNSVCKVEDIYYDSLQTAINDNSDNSVLEIIKDINEEIKINNRLMTIEGNNHKITASYLTDNLGIININDSTISIRNLLFEGNDKATTGIFSSSSSLYLENVEFNNFISDGTRLPGGVGLYFLNEKAKSNILEIKDNLFKNFSFSAIYVDNKNKNENEIIPIINLDITSSKFEPVIEEPLIGIVMIGNIKGSVTNNFFKNIKSDKSYAIYQNTNSNSVLYLNNQYLNVYQSIYQEIKS